ncbi:MAG: MFS transporter [SAR202 cluster bacterium]|nr:MFS transporter [SAR202 cluster bacterium]
MENTAIKANASYPARIKETLAYPGWKVVGACSFLAVFAGSIFVYGFPVFFLHIQRDMQLSAASTSLIFALSRGEAGIAGPITGWIVDKFDSRPIIIFGALMVGGGLAILSVVDTYWIFLTVFIGMVAVGNNTSFGQTFLAVTNRWFIKRKAIAMTLIITSYTIGGAVMVPVLSRGIDAFGWRSVLLYAGIFVVVLAIPTSFFIKRSPESVGINIDESPEAPDQPTATSRGRVSDNDFGVKEAMKTVTFWLMLIASSLRISVTSGLLVHAIPIMVWKGLSEQSGADALGVLFFIAIPARLFFGLYNPGIPTRYILCLGMAFGTMGVFTLIFVDARWSVYTFVAGIALLEGATTLNWVLMGQYYGRRNFATIIGIITAAYSIGMLSSPLFLGWIFDHTDSYRTGLIVFLFMYAASAIFFFFSFRPTRPVKLLRPLG